MEKFKYFIFGILSILLVSFTTNTIESFKPVKPSSIAIDCENGNRDKIKAFIKSSSTKRNTDGFILKDFEMTSNGNSNWYDVCLYFERY